MRQVVRDWFRLKDVLIGESPDGPEKLLWTWLGLMIDSKTEFQFFIENVSEGCGCGDDSGSISLPADIVGEAREEGRTDLDFVVEITLFDYGDGPDKVARMPLPAFLFYSSIATVLHARHVDSTLDPYVAIERMRASCSPEAQFSLVSSADRQFFRLTLDRWSHSGRIVQSRLSRHES